MSAQPEIKRHYKLTLKIVYDLSQRRQKRTSSKRAANSEDLQTATINYITNNNTYELTRYHRLTL